MEDGETIKKWGDGRQTSPLNAWTTEWRAFIRSDFPGPLKLGTDRMVTANELVDIIAEAADTTIHKEHDRSKPQGVRGRNSDNSQLREVLGWEPQVSLEEGMARTYRGIEERVRADEATGTAVGAGR